MNNLINEYECFGPDSCERREVPNGMRHWLFDCITSMFCLLLMPSNYYQAPLLSHLNVSLSTDCLWPIAVCHQLPIWSSAYPVGSHAFSMGAKTEREISDGLSGSPRDVARSVFVEPQHQGAGVDRQLMAVIRSVALNAGIDCSGMRDSILI